MVTRIPLPGNMIDSLMGGLRTGSNMYANIMNPILQREKQKQAEEHFKQQMAMREKEFARSGANSDLQRMIMQENLKRLQHGNDPNWDMQQLKSKLDYINGLGGQQQKPLQSFMPGIPGMGNEQQAMPMPTGLDEITAQQNGGAFPGMDMEAIKRALTYQALGLKSAPGEEVLQGPARDANDLKRLKDKFGENSEVYRNAHSAYQSQIDQKQDLRDLRERTKAGLKPGEKLFYDQKTGMPLGKEIPLTQKDRDTAEGTIMFDEFYPLVYKGGAPFSGEGSIRRLETAAKNYKTDPKAKKMFDDLLLSLKALAVTEVNEAATLKAGKTNQTYNRLRDSLKADDIPNLVMKLVKQYQIPASAGLNAGMRYHKALSSARKKAVKNVPATQKLYFNPELQAESQSQVIVIDPNGKKFETTEENAQNLPKGWKRG